MESQSPQFAQTHPELDLLTGHRLAKLPRTLVAMVVFLLPPRPRGGSGWGYSTAATYLWSPPDLATLGHPPRKTGREKRPHFGADIAVIMVTTSLPRLMISRSSLGPMKQLSLALSTVSLPPAITVSSPERTTYTFSVGEASGPAPPPGRKCERPTTNCFGPPASRPNRRSEA